MPGTLFVVATPIGNLEDITVRALRVLREVSIIAAEDTRRTAKLLARHAINTPTTSLHAYNERAKTPAILARLERGEPVALVSDAGTPTLSDPGHYLIQQALNAGYRVEPIPGASAVLAALAASGLAHDGFMFLGFPPTKAKDRKLWFDTLQRGVSPVVFFEAPHRIRQTLGELQSRVGDRLVCLARELTKTHEEFVIRPISVALATLKEPRGEYTVVVDLGQTTDSKPCEAAEPPRSRRQALAEVARSYGISPHELYQTIVRKTKHHE